MEKPHSPTVTPASFGKSKRLPGAREFKSVFDDNDFRISARHGVVLARYNQLTTSRLGVVVGKKSVRAAVQRARIKRICREHFRQSALASSGLDIILLIKSGCDALDNATLRKNIEQLFVSLQRRKNEALASQ